MRREEDVEEQRAIRTHDSSSRLNTFPLAMEEAQEGKLHQS
jgi:hypothetical protein